MLYFLFVFKLVFSLNLSRILENSFYKLQAGLNSEQVKLDSLKNILNLRARKITKAKSKTDYNKDVVTGLMAGSIPVSNEIAELQRKIVNLQANLENIKIRLSEMYSSKIDSLQRLLKMDNLSNEKTSEIKEKIYLYTGKKILVMPKIDLLTFYPDKIIGINLKILMTWLRKMFMKNICKKP